MENKPWVKYITEENLPNDDLRLVSTIIGLDATAKLMCEIPGTLISIPKNATVPARIAYIKEHYDGTKKSRLELSRICNMAESYIFSIYSKK